MRFGERYLAVETLRNTAETLMRLSLPYGRYICEDGTHVLFNRDYQPLWKVNLDGSHSSVDPHEWIKWKSQEWFYNDSNPPWRSVKTRKQCFALLDEHLTPPARARKLPWNAHLTQ